VSVDFSCEVKKKKKNWIDVCAFCSLLPLPSAPPPTPERRSLESVDVQRTFGPLIVSFAPVQASVNNKYDFWQKEVVSIFGAKLGEAMNGFYSAVSSARQELEAHRYAHGGTWFRMAFVLLVCLFSCVSHLACSSLLVTVHPVSLFSLSVCLSPAPSLEAEGTSGAVKLIIHVNELRERVHDWGEDVRLYHAGVPLLQKNRYVFPSDWLEYDMLEVRKWTCSFFFSLLDFFVFLLFPVLPRSLSRLLISFSSSSPTTPPPPPSPLRLPFSLSSSLSLFVSLASSLSLFLCLWI